MAQPDDRREQPPAAAVDGARDKGTSVGGSLSFRTWTEVGGSGALEAELVDSDEGKVRLRRKDGAIVVMPLDKLSPADREVVKRERARKAASADAASDISARPDHRPKRVPLELEEKPAIISYLKPEMELYVAAESYTPPEKTQGKIARTTCTCNLVCTCESVSACGCNLVKVRNPLEASTVCACNTVPVYECNTVTTCGCNRVAATTCSCNLVCTCNTVCPCEQVCSCVGACTCVHVCTCEHVCACQHVCTCEHVGGGGGFGGSVCVCVPVIH
jgi:hypothetical protein